jgi:hypothetical protein
LRAHAPSACRDAELVELADRGFRAVPELELVDPRQHFVAHHCKLSHNLVAQRSDCVRGMRLQVGDQMRKQFTVVFLRIGQTPIDRTGDHACHASVGSR